MIYLRIVAFILLSPVLLALLPVAIYLLFFRLVWFLGELAFMGKPGIDNLIEDIRDWRKYRDTSWD